MVDYVGYPTDSDVWNWTHQVSPVGTSDASLWGFAYAAQFKQLPPDLGTFQSWQQQCWTWVNDIRYWDVSYLLGFIQSHGRFPNSIPDLTQYLVAGGFTSLNANGSYAKNGTTPVGGNGYPPGSPASYALGYSGPAATPVASSLPSATSTITNPAVQNTAPSLTSSGTTAVPLVASASSAGSASPASSGTGLSTYAPSSGGLDGSTSTTTTTTSGGSGQLSGALAWIKANPLEALAIAGGAYLLLFGVPSHGRR